MNRTTAQGERGRDVGMRAERYEARVRPGAMGR